MFKYIVAVDFAVYNLCIKLKEEIAMISDEQFSKALEEIENLKKEIVNLKTDRIVDAALLLQQIIDLQRQVAILQLTNHANYIMSIVDKQLHSNPAIRSQVIHDITRFKDRIYDAEDPEELVSRFVAEWSGKLSKLNCLFAFR